MIFNCVLVEPSTVLGFLVKEISGFLTNMSAMSEAGCQYFVLALMRDHKGLEAKTRETWWI